MCNAGGWCKPSWWFLWPSQETKKQPHPHPFRSLKITFINMQEILITTAVLKYSWLYDKNTLVCILAIDWRMKQFSGRKGKKKNIRSLCIHLFPRRVLMHSITVLCNGPFDVPCIEVVQNFISTFHFKDLASSHVIDVKILQTPDVWHESSRAWVNWALAREILPTEGCCPFLLWLFCFVCRE